jgi:hypothetical protein
VLLDAKDTDNVALLIPKLLLLLLLFTLLLDALMFAVEVMGDDAEVTKSDDASLIGFPEYEFETASSIPSKSAIFEELIDELFSIRRGAGRSRVMDPGKGIAALCSK